MNSEFNYFDIDQLIAEDEKITVVFLNDAENIGELDPSSSSNLILKKGSKIELGWWLGKELFDRGFASLKLPPAYLPNSSFKENLRADPVHVSFQSLPFFYNFSLQIRKIPKLVPSNAEEEQQIIEYSWGKRWGLLLNQTVSYSSSSAIRSMDQSFIHSLNDFEKNLYNLGFNSATDFKNWKDSNSSTSSNYYPKNTNSNKRKRIL